MWPQCLFFFFPAFFLNFHHFPSRLINPFSDAKFQRNILPINISAWRYLSKHFTVFKLFGGTLWKAKSQTTFWKYFYILCTDFLFLWTNFICRFKLLTYLVSKSHKPHWYHFYKLIFIANILRKINLSRIFFRIKFHQKICFGSFLPHYWVSYNFFTMIYFDSKLTSFSNIIDINHFFPLFLPD